MTTSADDVWLTPPVVSFVEGESRIFVVVFPGASTISDPSMKVYKGATDISATACPSGTISVSGNTLTLKPIIGLTGSGQEYVLAVTATVDGQVLVRKVSIMVQKASDRR